MNGTPDRPQVRFRDVLRWIASTPWLFVRWCARSRWRALIGIVLLSSLLAGGSMQAYSYWSSPNFCNSCHIMEPYHAAWQRSAHRDVACVKCHFEPGIENELHGKWVAIKQLAAVVTGAYSSMPYAEVSDASCMRSGCHTRAELRQPFPFSDRGISFEHDKHLEKMPRGIQLACTSCHNQRLVTTHMEVDQSACFLCHFEKSEAAGKPIGDCKTCHGPPKTARQVAGTRVDHAAFEERGMRCAQCHAEMVSGSGAVGLDRCYSCHNKPEQIARAGDAGAMHVEHVTKRKMHCAQCHAFIQHGRTGGAVAAAHAAAPGADHPPEAGDRVESAGERGAPDAAADAPAAPRPVHEFAPAVSGGACADCHAGSHGQAQLLYAGRGAQSIAAARPDTMHELGVDCAGCHGALGGAPSAARDPAAAAATATARGADTCKSCHGHRYDAFVAALAENVGAMVAHLDARLAVAQRKMAGVRDQNGGVSREVYRAVTAATNDATLVRNGKAIHNPVYAVDVLRAADQTLAEAEAGLEIAPPEEQPLGFAAEDCTVCHGALPMPAELVLEGNRKYPHPTHVDKTGLGCADCHQGAAHPPHAPTKAASCEQCHKGEGK